MSRRRPGRDAAEIATLVMSIAVVAALIGGVVVVQLARGERPPVLDATASVEATRAEGGRFYLPVEIENSGDQAAAAVIVVVVQGVGDRETEHEVVIDYLPGHGRATATVVLSEDPRRAGVRVEVRSFLRK